MSLHTHKHGQTPLNVANVITDTSLGAILIISQRFFSSPGAESSREDSHEVMNIYSIEVKALIRAAGVNCPDEGHLDERLHICF